MTLGITPKGKRKRRHSHEVQEEKHELEEALKNFVNFTDNKTKKKRVVEKMIPIILQNDKNEPNTQMGERNGEDLSMLKPNEVTGGLTNDIPKTQMGERNGEDLSMLKPKEVTGGLTRPRIYRIPKWGKGMEKFCRC